MENPTIIYFIRHGLVHNPNNIYYGRLLGFPLNNKGRTQASATSDFLRNKPIAAFYSSPQLRTRETAKIIIEPHENKSIMVSNLLDETYSPFDGSPLSMIEERNWDVYTGAEPGFEQPIDVLTRAQRFISEVRVDYPGEHIVAVTHGDLIAFLMVWARGIPCTPQNKQPLYDEYLAHASVTTFMFPAGEEEELLRMEYTNPFKEIAEK